MPYFVVLLLELVRDQLQPPSWTWQELHRRTPELTNRADVVVYWNIATCIIFVYLLGFVLNSSLNQLTTQFGFSYIA